MYETVNVVQKIKTLSKKQGIKITELLEKCELSKNALSSMNSRGSWIQANSLAKIADYLGCSVDYLLGRTDKPEGIEPAPAPTGDSLSDEMLTRFNSLDFADKAQVISLIAELSKKKT